MTPFTFDHFYYLLMAARWTVALSAIAFVGGGIMGAALMLLRVQKRSGVVRMATYGIMRLIQATPLLMQLFLLYFGLSIVGLDLSAWTSVSIAMILYTGVFLGEIWRGCVEAVPRGQTDASNALALSSSQRMLYVILPQAARISYGPSVGFLVQVVKSTSLASIVGFTEIIRASQLVNNATLQPLTVYACVMLLYFAICCPLSLVSRSLEKRTTAPYRAAKATGCVLKAKVPSAA